MVVLTSFTQPTEGIRHRQQSTTVYVNDNNLGKGTLYIAESQLSWIGDSGNGFSIEYPHISLHAISRDLSAFPQECLFLMLDTPLGDEEQNNGEEENDDDNDSSKQETTEMRLVPDDRGMLDAMFHAMNACQALHPDPDDSFSDEDFFEDADDEIPMEETDSQMSQLRIGNMGGREYMARDMARDRAEDRAEDRVGDRGVGSRACIWGADRAEGSRVCTLGGDRAEGNRVYTLGGDRAEDNRACTLGGGRAEGSRACTLGGRGADREEDMEGDTETGTWPRTSRDGRSFFSGSISHRDNSVEAHQEHSPHMSLDSNFDDAEN